jgi:phosphoglycolate phosphatase
MNVVFDWAGTLADDQKLTWRLTDEVIRSFGAPSVDFETYRREFSLPAEGFYRKFCPGISFERIETAFAALCRARYPAEAALWPGVREGLGCLGCKHALYLMSTLDQAMLEAAVDRLGLQGAFRAVIGSVADKTRALPDLIAREGLSLDETVAFGDSVHDMQAAVAAGIEPLGAAYGYAGAAALERAGAELCFSGFAGLMTHLDKRAFAESRYFPVATVGGLIRDEQGNMLLVRTRKWSGLYGIPGGKVDYGETLENAFIREAREETGLEITDPVFIMNQDCVEHPQFYRPRHYILVNYTAKALGIRPAVKLNHESDACVWAAADQALGLELNEPTRILIEKVLRTGEKVLRTDGERT